MKGKRSLEKQQNVVAILWKFARQIQKNPEQGCVATADDGTRLSLEHLGDALAAIMDNFGYATISVQ